MLDAIIVGSGPAGTFAAYELRNRNVMVLDVGFQPPKEAADFNGNLFDRRQKERDLFPQLIGKKFESLHNLHKRTMSLKLKSPFMSYIVRDWERLSPVATESFESVMSFAQGGLANAWGAGVYRFNDADLEGFPISETDLKPFYDELTSHIGVSGTKDDLEPYFGTEEGLMDPIQLSKCSESLLKDYGAKRDYFNSKGVRVGRPRLAVLTRDHGKRKKYAYDNLEFFKPHISAIYNPAFTLNDLIDECPNLHYRPGFLVQKYVEHSDCVEVIAKNLKSGEDESFKAKKVFLAAGALNTAKLVLNSQNDYTTRLPIMDNPMSCIPVFKFSRIGAALETHESSMGQLNLVYEGMPEYGKIQATFYSTNGALRSDVIFEFPLSITTNLTWIKYLAPAMGLVMVFYPGKNDPRNYLALKSDGRLEVNFETEELGKAERELIRVFRKVGYLSIPSFCKYPKIGSSLHYAGMLPMKRNPAKYETDSNGLLFGSDRVYVNDGACFSQLPAKNLTFTIMANSMRIARTANRELG